MTQTRQNVFCLISGPNRPEELPFLWMGAGLAALLVVMVAIVTVIIVRNRRRQKPEYNRFDNNEQTPEPPRL